ncbi:hypothetical protein BASA83_012866 [Batrachochytrium salamandrivorans]|nr:hypothetical protein BASA83_012866 [Batrachochytrium salamandrivorans]
MKLISFAVISLLAITVSAHPGLGTSATNDAPQCDTDVITQKIRELTAVQQAQQELITKLKVPGKAEQEEQAIKSVMKTIEKELKRKDLSEDERLDLQNHYAESVDDLKKAESAQIPKKKQLDEAGEQRYCIEVKLNILEENLERKTEQDAKSKSKTEVSPGSSSHRDILQNQIDETFHDASDLSAANHVLSALSAKASKHTGIFGKITDIAPSRSASTNIPTSTTITADPCSPMLPTSATNVLLSATLSGTPGSGPSQRPASLPRNFALLSLALLMSVGSFQVEEDSRGKIGL